MRVPKALVPVLSKEIIKNLMEREQIALNVSKEQVVALLEELVLEELMVEDRLNAEVRELLKQFDSEIEKGRLDYRMLFEMTKKKLVKERNIVL